MNRSKLTPFVSVLLLTLTMSAVPAIADVNWEFTAFNVQPGGEPPITGTITTPDPPFGGFGDFRPPSVWPVSGQIVVPPGTLGGPGEIFGINDGEVPLVTIFHNGSNWIDLNFRFAGSSYLSNPPAQRTFIVLSLSNGQQGVWQILSIQLGDSDNDGVYDADDVCPGTVVPESVPTVRLGVNRFALTDNDGVFDTTEPKGNGPQKSYTIEQTAGCSCAQIIDELGLGNGHTKFGCSIGAMENWLTVLEGM